MDAMGNMRILYVSDHYLPFLGGAERDTHLLAKAMASRGNAVRVATIMHPGLPTRSLEDGIDVVRMSGLSTMLPVRGSFSKRRYIPPMVDPAMANGLRREIDNFRPSLVHVWGWSAYTCVSALAGVSTPLVLSIRDSGYYCAVRTLLHNDQICNGPNPGKCLTCSRRSYGLPKAAVATAGVFVGRSGLLKRVSALHSVSHFVAQKTEEYLVRGVKTEAIRAVIPCFHADVLHTSGDLDARLPAEPYILFVGALQKHKGIEVLLAAYSALSARPPLVLIGTQWPDSPKAYPAGVTVIANLAHNSVMRAWRRALFGVAPSICAEAFGNVIHEAMSQGVPVISTSVGGPPDIIRNGEDGYLVPPGDVGRLRSAMASLLENPVLRERMGHSAQLRSLAFSETEVVPRYEALYAQCLSLL